MTLGEFKELTKDCDDDIVIIFLSDDGYADTQARIDEDFGDIVVESVKS